jgi:hypothetical protein
MILRALTLAGGLTGAAGLSQFPEFSQQYIQRLGGAVDELSRVVEEFDQDAARVGLSRETALVDLASGGTMGAERAGTMASTIERHRKLSGDLSMLQGAGPFSRARLLQHLTDTDIVAKAWDNYKPAMPVTFEGLFFAGTGLLAGLAVIGMALRLLALPFRRRRKSAQAIL